MNGQTGSMGRRGNRLACAMAAAVMAALALGSSADASSGRVEAIADGGFENSTCHEVESEYGPVTECESPSWTTGDWQAGICGVTGCFANAAHGDGYLQLGRAYMGTYSSMTGAATQTVDLPPGPKKLIFAIRSNYDNPVTSLVASVEVDGDPVFTTSSGEPSDYATESVDMSAYTGEHEISFRAACDGAGMPVMRTCDGIAVDDVSLRVAPELIPGQIDAVADGGFEATECPTSGDLGCFNTDWEASGGFQAYPCLSPPCKDSSASGSGYLGLGGAPMVSNTEEGSVRQQVNLPQAGPKILSFWLRSGTDDVNSTGRFSVLVDGEPLLNRSFAGAPPTYGSQTVDLSGYAGPTTIEFAVRCTRATASVPVGCDSFFVDDVSLPVELETAFGRTPPEATTRRRARFTFSSNAAGAVFQCRLDGEDLGACTSPLRVKVGKGRHRLAVRAVAGETTESAPARHRWRVTRRR